VGSGAAEVGSPHPCGTSTPVPMMRLFAIMTGVSGV
jgi:hypothetical protein